MTRELWWVYNISSAVVIVPSFVFFFLFILKFPFKIIACYYLNAECGNQPME